MLAILYKNLSFQLCFYETIITALLVCVSIAAIFPGFLAVFSSEQHFKHAGNTYPDLINLLVDEKNTSTETEMAALKQRLDNIEAELLKEKQKQGTKMAFTVKTVNKASANNLVKFSETVFNYNNMYNLSTGECFCQIPGNYVFAATIIREPGIIESYCYIYVNDIFTVGTVGQGSTSGGYSSGTNVLVYHLGVGDRVRLSNCDGVDHMFHYSSFRGFLITPDI